LRFPRSAFGPRGIWATLSAAGLFKAWRSCVHSASTLPAFGFGLARAGLAEFETVRWKVSASIAYKLQKLKVPLRCRRRFCWQVRVLSQSCECYQLLLPLARSICGFCQRFPPRRLHAFDAHDLSRILATMIGERSGILECCTCVDHLVQVDGGFTGSHVAL
jgi:hypothetical protein